MENTATPVKKTGWTSIPVAGAIGVVYADKTGVSTPNTSMPYLTWYDSNVSHTAILAIGDDGGIQVSTNVASMKLVVDVQRYCTAGDTAAGGYVPPNLGQTRFVDSFGRDRGFRRRNQGARAFDWYLGD